MLQANLLNLLAFFNSTFDSFNKTLIYETKTT